MDLNLCLKLLLKLDKNPATKGGEAIFAGLVWLALKDPPTPI